MTYFGRIGGNLAEKNRKTKEQQQKGIKSYF